jgi:riboflavin kinase/FMN adenylyltransferase
VDSFYEIKPSLAKNAAIALGFFDGVHPGHQVVIAQAVADAKRLSVRPALVTFKDHPRALTTGATPKLLTILPERLELFAKLGVELCLVLSFSEEICLMTPRQYVETVLVGSLGAKSISVGQNHHFGRNREGNAELLATLGKELGFCVNVAPMVIVDGLEVSSSRIRQALENGHVGLAAKLLQRPYSVTGNVIYGQARGRQIGFPTANIEVNERKQLPKPGVYAGFASALNEKSHPCVINLGFKPTVSNERILSLEAHIIDYNQDLYNKELKVEFWSRLRNEQKFAGVDELKNQIGQDCLLAKEFFVANQEPSDTSPKEELTA